MKIQRRLMPAAIAIAALMLVAAPLQSRADDMSRQNSQADQMMHKLGRGIVNLFTGIVEVPKNIALESICEATRRIHSVLSVLAAVGG